jgi:hypothetical protein
MIYFDEIKQKTDFFRFFIFWRILYSYGIEILQKINGKLKKLNKCSSPGRKNMNCVEYI